MVTPCGPASRLLLMGIAAICTAGPGYEPKTRLPGIPAVLITLTGTFVLELRLLDCVKMMTGGGARVTVLSPYELLMKAGVGV